MFMPMGQFLNYYCCVDECYLCNMGIASDMIFQQPTVFVFVNMASKLLTTS